MNNEIKSANNSINQWKDSKDVINWFQNIPEKAKSCFIQFDIDAFYPSINTQLFDAAINYAKTITTIDDNDLNIIMQSRKTLLFTNSDIWVKKLAARISMFQWAAMTVPKYANL